MTAPIEFECRVVQGLNVIERFTTIDETEALEWAAAHVSPVLAHVSIEASGPVVSTFAMRYIAEEHPGRRTDSGWRCWHDGTFVGAISLDRLFGRVEVS